MLLNVLYGLLPCCLWHTRQYLVMLLPDGLRRIAALNCHCGVGLCLYAPMLWHGLPERNRVAKCRPVFLERKTVLLFKGRIVFRLFGVESGGVFHSRKPIAGWRWLYKERKEGKGNEMNGIEALRALLSDYQRQYYRFWVRYNTARNSVYSSDNDLHEYSLIIEGILYYRSWIDIISNDLHSKMRCK